MNQTELKKDIDSYLDERWEAIVRDIESLVQIPSVEELDKKAPGAPFGSGPRAALTAALDLAQNMGFEVQDVDGYVGFADLAGASETQLGIIGHLDVVPAGPGWNFEPYALTRKDGYLIGRGTLDDKGPSVLALHAMKFWKEQSVQLPYTVRFIFGTNEETGMADVPYYRQRYADPAFLFTPDAEFPVCFGEKGGYDGLIVSQPIPENSRTIVKFEGGVATNAVPGVAYAVVKADRETLPACERIEMSEESVGLVRLTSKGKGAHAAMPAKGISAIGILVDYLLDNDLCSEEEREFLLLEQKLLSHTDGIGVGIKSEDEYFGPLTVIGGTIQLKQDKFHQTLDCRFPTSISGEFITQRLAELTETVKGSYSNTGLREPFLVKPDTPEIQALLAAYNEATGEDAKPFTMGGGTYASEFTSAASFGPEKPWVQNPEWVGDIHGPDEGVSEDLLKESFRIYVRAIGKIMELDL